MLGACTSFSIPTPPKESLKWEARGKASIVSPDYIGTINLRWQHYPDSDFIYLSGPLGQGASRISATPDRAILETHDGKLIRANNLDQLAIQALRLPLPLRQLPAILQGQLTELSGWQLTYRKYQTIGAQKLPRLIELSQAPYAAKLVITDWIQP